MCPSWPRWRSLRASPSAAAPGARRARRQAEGVQERGLGLADRDARDLADPAERRPAEDAGALAQRLGDEVVGIEAQRSAGGTLDRLARLERLLVDKGVITEDELQRVVGELRRG